MKKGEMLGIMIKLAVDAHYNQFDKGGKPYILHALRVMGNLKTDDEELQCIGIGHDVFEDSKISANDMRKVGISERVIDGIMGVTKIPGESYEEYKEKVKSHVDRIRVKMADIEDNSDIRRLKGVTQKDVERTMKYFEFYDELKELI